MKRAFAALVASSISSIITYPLDTLFVTNQLHKKPKNYYSGIKIELLCTCAATGVFYQTYETCFENKLSPAIASTLSTITSTTVHVPLSILKRKIQTKNNIQKFNFAKTSFLDKFKNIYFVSCVKKIPKNILKYSIYENSLKFLWLYFDPIACGAISSFMASLISNTVMFPIETAIVKVSCGINKNIFDFFKQRSLNEIYNGFLLYLLYSVTANVIGHSILESLSPRY
tara:strand:- start:2307 stop:2990 length:684 start_codon:yes stop_codon:yes gene_type:complete